MYNIHILNPFHLCIFYILLYFLGPHLLFLLFLSIFYNLFTHFLYSYTNLFIFATNPIVFSWFMCYYLVTEKEKSIAYLFSIFSLSIPCIKIYPGKFMKKGVERL